MSESLENRTVRWLREKEDYSLAASVSCYNMHIKRTKDLFGIIDVIAVGPKGTLMIQVTSSKNVPARIKKMCAENTDITLELVRTPGVMVEVWGWRKVKGVWCPSKILLSESTVELYRVDPVADNTI